MYYMMSDSNKPMRWLNSDDYLEKYDFESDYDDEFDWYDGTRFEEQAPVPFKISLLPYDKDDPDHDQFVPSYYDDDIVLMRDDLIAAMESFGVDNLDKYEVELLDPDNGKVYTDYKAVNIIGVVSAADMSESKATVHDNIALVDVSFDELVVDESKTEDLLLFRLAENLMTVLIHESLRDHLLEKGFDDIEFYKLDEAATP